MIISLFLVNVTKIYSRYQIFNNEIGDDEQSSYYKSNYMCHFKFIQYISLTLLFLSIGYSQIDSQINIGQTNKSLTVRDSLHLLIQRVQRLEEKGDQSTTAAIIAGTASFIAVLAAGLLTLISQLRIARKEDARSIKNAENTLALAQKEAVYKQTDKMLEYKLKQMELFYAPMFALLNQSKGLYAKMSSLLMKRNPNTYAMRTDPQGKVSLHIQCADEQWKEFRLLDQLPALRKNEEVFPLINGIVDIGSKMKEIIYNNAGYASSESIPLLGEYLAHFAILSTIYNDKSESAYEAGWHVIGYYPRSLNERIENDYRALSAELDLYAKAGKQLLHNDAQTN